MRGNVVDLAVGVTVGAAFTTLVTQFSKSFLEPLIVAIGADDATLAGTVKVGAGVVDWGAFVGTLIGFLMTAAVVYFLVVLPMNRFVRTAKEPAPQPPTEEIKLLMEIRDALLAGQRPPSPRSPEREREPRRERSASQQ